MSKKDEKDEELLRTEALLREADEELQKEYVLGLWRKYGAYAIGLCVLIVVATGASVAWKSHVKSTNEQRTDALYAWLQIEGEGDRLNAAREDLSEPQTTQQWLKLFYAANDALSQDDLVTAQEFYAIAMKNRELGGDLRWLGDLMQLRIKTQEAKTQEEFEDLKKRYVDLGSKKNNPWRALALMDGALIAGEQLKNTQEALKLLSDASEASYGSSPLLSMINDYKHLYTIQSGKTVSKLETSAGNEADEKAEK